MIKKIIRKLLGGIIKLIWPINTRIYMKLYVKYLSYYGMNIKGKPMFIAGSAYFDGIDYALIEIGDKSVISIDVLILTHDYSITRAAIAAGHQPKTEFRILKGIKIGENSFIGARCVLLPGTEIGDNVIIGAGSVVRGKVPDNSIVAGNPAKVIGETTQWFNNKLSKDENLHKYL